MTIASPPAHVPPQIVDERLQLHLSGDEAVLELEQLKARLAHERDLELTLSWRLQRKGTQL